MVSDRDLLQTLWRYGHFRNPEVLRVARIEADDLVKLTLGDPVVIEAVRSYQSMMGLDLERLTIKHHGRSAIHDGRVGPATRELTQVPRCDVADYFEPGAIGSGSWPMPCQKEGVKFHVNKAGMPSRIVAAWPEIQRKVVRAYALMGLRMVEVPTAAEANIQTFFRNFGGGIIGQAEFNNRSCSDRVTCALSNSYVGHNAGLWKHELGHNMNRQHTRGGTMNPSIQPELDPVNFTWTKDDPSYAGLVQMFGGEPVDDDELIIIPNPGPLPEPTPPPPAPGPAPRPFLDFIRWLFGW
jgi:hypothetical protein